MSVGQSTRCSHHVINDVIDEFVLHEVSTMAVDAMMDMIDAIIAKLPYPESHSVLVISLVGTQPIAHTFSRLRKLARKYPKRDQNRVALILRDSSALRVFEVLMRPMGSSVRFFKENQREEAIAWLKATATPDK